MIHPDAINKLKFIYDSIEGLDGVDYAIARIGKNSSLIDYDAEVLIPMGFYDIVVKHKQKWGEVIHTRHSITKVYNGTYYPKLNIFTRAPKHSKVIVGTPYFTITDGVEGSKNYVAIMDIRLRQITLMAYTDVRADKYGNIYGKDSGLNEVKIC